MTGELVAGEPRRDGLGTPHPDTAWSIVVYGFVLSLLSTGLRFSIGPFVQHLMHDFQLSPSGLSAIIAAAMLLYGFAMPVVGWLADTWSSRSVLMMGITVLCGALALAAVTRSATVFALAFAGLASVGQAATSQVAMAPVISRWFIRRRGMAMMCLASGSMGGIAVLTPLASFLIGSVGWRAAYLILAAGVFLILFPASWWTLRHAAERPRTLSLESSPSFSTTPITSNRWQRALGTTSFWFLAVGFFGCGFSMNLLAAHGVPMLEHHGFDTMTASYGIGLIGLVSIFGTIALGVAADRLGRPFFLSLIYLVRGFGFLGMMTVGTEWQLFSVAAVGGLAWAGSSSLTSAITADLFGVRSVGTLFGALFVSHQLGAAAGSYLGGWSFEHMASYHLPFAFAAGLLFLGSFLSLRLRTHVPLPESLAAEAAVRA